jgi:hypothetical protein
MAIYLSNSFGDFYTSCKQGSTSHGNMRSGSFWFGLTVSISDLCSFNLAFRSVSRWKYTHVLQQGGPAFPDFRDRLVRVWTTLSTSNRRIAHCRYFVGRVVCTGHQVLVRVVSPYLSDTCWFELPFMSWYICCCGTRLCWEANHDE